MASLTIIDLRKELGLSQGEFAVRIGLGNKASVSLIERGASNCSLPVALAIEELSGGRIDAATLNGDVAAARAGVDQVSRGGEMVSRLVGAATADRENGGSSPSPADSFADEVALITVTCMTCGERQDDVRVRSCTYADCPHGEREAA